MITIKKIFKILIITSIFINITQYTDAQIRVNLDLYKEANDKLPKIKEGENRIVFIGNSITQGWMKLSPEFFAGKSYINRGINGETTPQSLLRFRQDVVNLSPKAVIILAGINDIAGNTGISSIEMIENNIYSMIDIALNNNIKVVLCSLLPADRIPWNEDVNSVSKVMELNKRLKEYVQKHHLVFCDYFSAMADSRNGLPKELSEDGLHPNKAGYAIMEKVVEKAIDEVLSKK